MAAAAAMECNGAPIDTATLELLREHWTDIQDDLIAAIDANYGVYEGRTFKVDRFEAYLNRHDIPWPRLESGALDLSRDTFRQMAKSYAVISPLHELRHALSEMRLNDLAVGHDGRNRTILSAFRAKTGRNQPSNTKFIFGPSVWLRGLIKPPPGHAVAYVDWSNQEFGIAAKLSGDEQMMAAYQSGDPYLAFGKQCGMLPPDATKASHPDARQLLKGCVLGILFGMEAKTLALNIGQPEIVARDLLRLHRETYPKFWQWSDAAVDLRHAARLAAHRLRLARARRRKSEPAFAAKFPDAGKRRGDDADRGLPGDRARHRGLRARSRRLSNLRADRSH